MKNYFALSTLIILFSAFVKFQPNAHLVLDERAKKYIDVSKQASLTEAQIESLNFFFQKSFVLNEYKKCPTCPVIDPATLDIKQFDAQRADKKRVMVYATRPGTPITLLSWDEVRSAYADIAKKYTSKK